MLVYGILFVLAGLFGIGPWTWPSGFGIASVSWALVFVIGILMCLQGRI